MNVQKTGECKAGICTIADDQFPQSVKARRQVREFLGAQLTAPLSPLNLTAKAGEYLASNSHTDSLLSLPFDFVLKLLFVSGGGIRFLSNSEYRECSLTGGANFDLRGKQLLTADLDQILLTARNLIESERAIDCTAVRKDHVCKPLYQLAQLKEIERQRKYDANATFESVREMMSMVCYDMRIAMGCLKSRHGLLPGSKLSRQAC